MSTRYNYVHADLVHKSTVLLVLCNISAHALFLQYCFEHAEPTRKIYPFKEIERNYDRTRC